MWDGNEISGGIIEMTAPPVADRILSLRTNAAGVLIVPTIDDLPRCLVTELRKDSANGIERIVEIKMLFFDIEKNCMLRVEVDQCAITLIAFRDKEFPCLIPVSIGAKNRDFGADVVRRRFSPDSQHMRSKRRSCRFPMSASDYNTFFPQHDRR